MNKFYKLEERKEVPVYTKYKPKPANNRWKNYKLEKDYDFYKCDYCEDEIKILKKGTMQGGIVEFTHLLTRRGNIKLALCNKCLNPVLKILEEESNAN